MKEIKTILTFAELIPCRSYKDFYHPVNSFVYNRIFCYLFVLIDNYKNNARVCRFQIIVKKMLLFTVGFSYSSFNDVSCDCRFETFF